MFYPIEFIYNSQRLEGSGLSMELTQQLLMDIPEFLFHMKEAMEYDQKLTLDILEAKNTYLAFTARLKERGPYTFNKLCEIHHEMFSLTDETAGQIRTQDSMEYDTVLVYPMYKFLPYLMEGYDLWYAQTPLKGIELAAEVHRRIFEIHPFVEGNGRLARTVMNLVLNDAGLEMLDIKFNDVLDYERALVEGTSTEWVKGQFYLS